MPKVMLLVRDDRHMRIATDFGQDFIYYQQSTIRLEKEYENQQWQSTH
jgi:hypothetical protein